MRPATFEPQQIIEAGLALQAEERNITGFALRNRVGGGNPRRLKQVWDEYLSSLTEVSTAPMAELPVEVVEKVKAVSSALAERINQLAIELNDKAVRAAELRVAEVSSAAGEQTAQVERELVDAAQTVEELEKTLDTLRDEHNATLGALDESRKKEQSQAVELAQLRERLASTEKQLVQLKEVGEQYRQQKEDLQMRLDEAEKSASAELKARQAVLDKALKEATEAREAKAAMSGEIKALKSYNEQLSVLLAGRKEPKE